MRSRKIIITILLTSLLWFLLPVNSEAAEVKVTVDETAVPVAKRPALRKALHTWRLAIGNDNIFQQPGPDGTLELRFIYQTVQPKQQATNQSDYLGMVAEGMESSVRTVTLYGAKVNEELPKTSFVKLEDFETAAWEHEIGHAFGLGHDTTNARNIMSPVVNSPVQQITQLDLNQLNFVVSQKGVNYVQRNNQFYSQRNLIAYVTAVEAVFVHRPLVVAGVIAGLIVLGSGLIFSRRCRLNRSWKTEKQRS